MNSYSSSPEENILELIINGLLLDLVGTAA
jgi:hypothetical protein